MKGAPAVPRGPLTSMPTWSNTPECFTTSAFFSLSVARDSPPRRKLMNKLKSTRSKEIDPTAGDGVAGDGGAGDGVAGEGVAGDGVAGDGVREAAAEVETTTGAVVHAFTTGAVVQVFLLAGNVPSGAWSGDGQGKQS